MENIKHPEIFGTVTVGERGQIVIPSHLREKLRLKKGDKLMVFCHLNQIIGLVRSNEMYEFLNQITSRMVKQVDKFKEAIKKQGL
ncbi:MAG: AbrB/MazE/SpoVT family DNA-binding domain-containing protein [Patescibacteria group bacterium]